MSRKVLFVLGSALVLIALLLAAGIASGQEPPTTPDCTVEPCPTWIVEQWSNSGHADADAEAFRHWDAEDIVEVPADCARCHSAYGFLDFLGADGSEMGVVDAAAPVDSVVSCEVCHTPNAIDLQAVTFPSGAVVTDLGESTRCAVCHQGRASGLSVARAVEGLPLDEVAELRFINIHYFAAAASLYGSEVMGGYQYEGKAYQPSFEHVEGYDTCAGCHNPHALEPKVEECAVCHTGVASVEDLTSIRMPGSLVDYDGDGSVDESIHDELEGMQEILYAAIQSYAANVVEAPIVYDAARYPYFFGDTDANGEVNGEESGYASWTPRLLEAAYNFQTYEKDPGAFAHNARYYAQLMFDSVESLNEGMMAAGTLALHRNPPGHFDGTTEAFRHWDADGAVPASCTKCHTSEGIPFQALYGTQIAQEPSTSLACSTCHVTYEGFGLYTTDEVQFPSGAVLSFGEGVGANLCINCHQGRAFGGSVDAAIARAGVGDDDASADLRFINVHYFAAGATLFGAEAHGIYQFEGKEYAGRFMHVPGYDTCTGCHTAHTLTVKLNECATCHAGVVDVEAIRLMSRDWDGDGADEGVAGEVETLEEMLLVAIQAYATDVVGAPVVYDAYAYPYWFNDAGESYASWTPDLLRAAYNYQYVAKDPGAFAHNARYVAQALYDSIEAVGGDVSGLTRP